MKRTILALGTAFCLLSGCAPHAEEPQGLALARVLGVDGGEEITLTVLCPGQLGEEPVVGQVSAPEFCAARAILPAAGEREVALANLSYLIINKEADLAAVLLEVLWDREMSPSATVWYAEDAAELLEEGADPAGRLEVLSDHGADAPTVVNALAKLEHCGAVRLPVLEVEDGQIVERGSVLWKAEK